MMEKEIVLSVKRLSKKIGKKTIVQNINFDITKGEVFGLIGPNGAGKTTIIRAIVSLIHRSSGTVMINGKSVADDFKTTIADVGGIIENPEFYMYLSGMENLKQFARMSRKPVSPERINEVVAQVKLTNAINNKVKTYSLGMRQRLGLAQALIHQPSLLVLDEPTNGLDPQGMAEFREIIRSISSQGTAVLISSHLLAEIQQITDRFAIIEKGRLTHIEDMQQVNGGSTPTYLFKVADVALAEGVLRQLNYPFSLDDAAYIQVNAEEDQIPAIIQEFVAHGVAIFEVSAKKVSLEERFFQLTEGGNV